MKRNDIALIVLIASVSLGVSYLIAQAVVGSPQKQKTKVADVTLIKSDITPPDKKFFNDQAVNPVVPINIGGSSDGNQTFN